MKLSTALKAAKHFKPDVNEKDLSAVRAVLVANADQIDVGNAPADYKKNFADEPIEDDVNVKSFSIPHEPAIKNVAKGGFDEAPSDMWNKLRAEIQEATKQFRQPENKGGPGVPGNVTVKSGAELMHEMRARTGQTCFREYDTAYGAHQYLKSLIVLDPDTALDGRKKFGEWATRKGYSADWVNKSFATSSSTQGGPLVPELFQPDLINLVADFGAAYKLFSVIPMSGPELVYPRMTGRLTMYYPLENVAGTTSDLAFDNVHLNAVTGIVNSVLSRQSLDDANIALADVWFREMARAIASGIDDAVFTGDGTGAYGNIVGIARLFGVAAGTGGYAATGGGTTGATTQAEVVTWLAKLPSYARNNLRITCTPQIQDLLFTRLSQSTPGGLLQSELTANGSVFRFMGIPIVLNEKMNNRNDASSGTHPTGFTAGDDIDAIAGNFNLAAKFGQRMAIELAMDTSRGFDTYSVYMRGVARFDFVAHDVGSSTTAGPIVSLWQT